MFTVNIVYYEGWFNRTVKTGLAKAMGKPIFRPLSHSATAQLPIVPRPGDRIFFPLPKDSLKYFINVEDFDEPAEETYLHPGVVQWVELQHNSEELYAVVTDEGHTGRGVYEGDIEKELAEASDLWGKQ